ncbi:MAG: hypothetical protein ACI9YL_000917 [Luteibaculaceae bacterium]|jgi:hypothetical protein
MTKALSLVFALFLFGANTMAQEENTEHRFYDLYLLLNDGEYQKCVNKASRIVGRDKYRREPLPYLYMSMAYEKMYDIVDYRIENPGVLKDACSAAYKYRKKDKSDLFLEQYKDFFEDLRIKAKAEGLECFEDDKYSKAKSWFYKTVKFFPEDYGAWAMLAISQYYAKDKSGGDLSFQKMKKALDDRYKMFNMPDADSDFFKGMELYSNYLIKIGQSDSARATINWADSAIEESNSKRMEFKQHRF